MAKLRKCGWEGEGLKSRKVNGIYNHMFRNDLLVLADDILSCFCTGINGDSTIVVLANASLSNRNSHREKHNWMGGGAAKVLLCFDKRMRLSAKWHIFILAGQMARLRFSAFWRRYWPPPISGWLSKLRRGSWTFHRTLSCHKQKSIVAAID